MAEERNNGSFWSTLPGLLTAIAAIITAGTGAYLALRTSHTRQTGDQTVGPSPVPTPATPHFTGPMGALEHGISYSGGDLYDRPAASAEQCAQLCANDDRCRAVTFIISQQRCWIKGAINPTQQSPDMVSARKQG